LGDFEKSVAVALEALARHRRENPAIAPAPLDEVIERLELREWIDAGGAMDDEGLGRFLDRYLADSTRLEHRDYLSHQIAPPDVPATIADLVHGRLNNITTVYELGPAAAAVEVVVVEWMLEKVGFAGGAGVLTHGGSLGNLTGLLAARARAAPDSWVHGTPPGLAVLTASSAHYSVRRAMAILGFGEAAIVPVESDAFGRMVTADLPAAIARAEAAGRRPIAAVASACATAAGLHDDLRAVGELCRERELWLHVDAAHGASALLSARHRHLLDGIDLADSVIWDAHKMMGTSAMCTGVLFRRATDLARTFHQQATYLMYGDELGPDISTQTFEATKAPIGLKLFLNLAWRGEGGLGSYVARQYDKTRRIHRAIAARPAFECPYVPETNILCFRHRPSGDATHLEVRRRLAEESGLHLSSAELDGRRHFRLTVMSPDTDEADVGRLLDEIERLAASAQASAASALPSTLVTSRLSMSTSGTRKPSP
jgi:L-2,4-diaminobutyrate decarboxylase